VRASVAGQGRAGRGVGPDRGRSFQSSCDRLADRLPAAGWRRELQRLTGRRGLLSLTGIVSASLPAQSPGERMPPISGAVPACDHVALQRRRDHGAIWRRVQAKARLIGGFAPRPRQRFHSPRLPIAPRCPALWRAWRHQASSWTGEDRGKTGSFLRHPGLAQPGVVGGFKKGTDLWHAEIYGLERRPDPVSAQRGDLQVVGDA